MHKTIKLALALQLAVTGIALGEERTTINEMDRHVGSMIDGNLPKTALSHVRASKLIGMEVYSHADKHLGEVNDIVLDRDLKKIGYAVLSYGGIAGIGDKLFALPQKELQFSGADNKRLYLPFDEQVLKNAPGFDKRNWPAEANAEYFNRLDKYYREQSLTRGDLRGEDLARDTGESLKNGSRDLGMNDELTPDGAEPAAGMIDQGLVWNRRVSSLIGANVESPQGENLGEIKDVVLDWNKGDVKYAVLSHGGILGMGDKLFAVPIDKFRSQHDDQKLILNVSKDQLKSAPGFNKDQWPNMADENWDKTVRDYYRAADPTINDSTPTR